MRDAFSLDRTLTLGLLATMTLETAGALMWAGAMGHRVSSLESGAKLDRPINMRLTRLEVQVSGIRHSLERIEADLSDVEDELTND